MATSLEQRRGGIVERAVGRGADVVAERIEHYTGVAHAVSDVLRQRGEPQLANVIEQGVSRADNVTKYLRDSDPSRLMSDMQEFARGRKWFMTGAGFVGGLLIARAVRASMSDSYAEWHVEPYVEQFDQEKAYERK